MKTAYFVFADSIRDDVVRNLKSSTSAEATKISVATVTKDIGMRWKALSDEERQSWKIKATELNAAIHMAAANDEGEDRGNADEGGEEESGPCHNLLLPLSLVKRIACSDPDNNSRISAEGLVALAKATDLLLGLVVQGSAKAAKAQKRRTIQLKDFVSALKVERRLAVIGLKDIELLVKAKSQSDASVKALKVAEARDHSIEAGGDMPEKGNDAENQDPEKASKDLEVKKPQGGGAKKARGRPAANDAVKKSAKRAKAEELASKGTRKIDAFFAKAAKVIEKESEEEVD